MGRGRGVLVVCALAAAACGSSSAATDAGGDGGDAADGGSDAGTDRTPRDRLEAGVLEETYGSRPGWATLAVHGGGAIAFETRRDEAYGHQRRLRSLERGWTVQEADGEVFHDVAVHPSGAITLVLERTDAERRGYLLQRLSRDGRPLRRQELPAERLPESDWDAGLPVPPWRHRARPQGALAEGWVRLVAAGDGLVVVHQSLVDLPERPDLVSGVTRLDWDGERFLERWSRVVDGLHLVEPPIWAYDDFRFIDVLVRPLLAVDPVDDAIVVGRTFTKSRCRAGLRLFGELSATRCFEEATPDTESRVLPFFFTVFSAAGERLGSHVFVPERGFYYGVHAMAAGEGAIALAGVVAEAASESAPMTYPSRPGGSEMVAFDGLLAVVGRDGTVRSEHHVDRGRGDLFLSVRWLGEGIVAAGATDWDRWPGGMSVSRGADPWVAFLEADGTLTTRAFERPWPSRHALAYDALPLADRWLVVGADDAPMTHSGDGGRTEAMTFGSLALTLR